MTTETPISPARARAVRGDEMLLPDEVAAMLRLHKLGWGAKRLSKEFGCARNTIRRYLRAGGTVPFAQAPRKTAFDGLDDWLRERFFRHDGNADVIRQELASEHGIVIGVRSVELRVQPWRRELRAYKKATVSSFSQTLPLRRGSGVRLPIRCGPAAQSLAPTIHLTPKQNPHAGSAARQKRQMAQNRQPKLCLSRSTSRYLLQYGGKIIGSGVEGRVVRLQRIGVAGLAGDKMALQAGRDRLILFAIDIAPRNSPISLFGKYHRRSPHA